jgi:hypothetical protein
MKLSGWHGYEKKYFDVAKMSSCFFQNFLNIQVLLPSIHKKQSMYRLIFRKKSTNQIFDIVKTYIVHF